MIKYKLSLPNYSIDNFFLRKKSSDYLALTYVDAFLGNRLSEMIIKDGEQKEFHGMLTIYMELSNNKDFSFLIGSTELPIIGNIIIKNGECDINIKPFNFDSLDLEYEILGKECKNKSYSDDDCIEYLSNYITDLNSEIDISPNAIKIYLLKQLKIEQINE